MLCGGGRLHYNDDDRLGGIVPLLNGGDCCDCMSEAEHRQRCEGEDAPAPAEGDQ
jgi:hypothetical protein